MHPVYEVIYEVELTAKDTKVRRKLDLIVKCPRLMSPPASNSPPHFKDGCCEYLLVLNLFEDNKQEL